MFASLAGLFSVLTLGLLSPGPDFLLVVRNSVGASRARGLATMAGISVGLGIQTIAIALGLAAVPPKVFTALQLAGAAYLAWLGLRALLPRTRPEGIADDAAGRAAAMAAPAGPSGRAAPLEHRILSRSGQNSVFPSPPPSIARSGFVDGLVCNLTNPKAFVFFTGIFAQLVPPGSASGWRIGLPLAITLHGAVLWTLVVLALQSPPVATRLERVQHRLPPVFGGVLLAFAVWLGAMALRG